MFETTIGQLSESGILGLVAFAILDVFLIGFWMGMICCKWHFNRAFSKAIAEAVENATGVPVDEITFNRMKLEIMNKTGVDPGEHIFMYGLPRSNG